MARTTWRTRRAFSLLELVIVVVILGILAAIAVPRMSRSAAAASDNALQSDLSIIRNALDLFQTEHGGNYPAQADITNALTQYSDNIPSTYSATSNAASGIIYGPYLRTIPTLPVGANKGLNTFTASLGGSFGWVYTPATGAVTANCTNAEVDARGVAYNTY